ncbi:MAG: SulP family inorganic anion transporter [Synechococcus sp. BS307-5m-G38]|nr:SulP family inorganic anion transporter [Synechococcus sp. BS307-5m-G38]
MPGLGALRRYRFRSDFSHDLFAGLSVAAVALPVSIAYAELAGLSPAVGLYASIGPLLVYALFGTSPQLMVNPDAASCAILAAAVAPLAGGDPALYLSLATALTLFTGVLCVLASAFRLGALADFLSRPILVGFLNGIALSIFLGQIGKVLGFQITASRIVPRLIEILSKLPSTQVPTLLVALFSVAVMWLVQRFLPRVPAALAVLVLSAVLVGLLDLPAMGVAVLAPVPAGLPMPSLPFVPLETVPKLLGSAAGLALVLFTSGTITSRSFASRGGYDVDVDRELVAYGAANIASSLTQGFVVTGADSRTAMAVTSGGKTQVTGLVAAATIALVLLLFTGPLQFVPVAALGVVLIAAALSLLDVISLRQFWRMDRREFGLSLITTAGVVALGSINGILVAVALAIIRFVKHTARPSVELLGEEKGLPGLHSIDRHGAAQAIPGMVLFRFNAPLVFFNADHFKQCALSAAQASGKDLRWFVIDAIPISDIDINGLVVLKDLQQKLASRNIQLVWAGRQSELLMCLERMGEPTAAVSDLTYPTLRQAVNAYRAV